MPARVSHWKAAVALALTVGSAVPMVAAPPPVSTCWVNGQCNTLLAQLSPDGQQMYDSMGPKLKQWFDTNVNGRAAVIVDKRDTFIKGNWHGYDAFKFIAGQIDKKQQAGTLSAADAATARHILQVCQDMTPAQRSAFVQLLDLDTGRVKAT